MRVSQFAKEATSMLPEPVLFFPMLALALGLTFDVFGKKAVIGKIRFPSSVFQFTTTMLLSALVFAVVSKCQQLRFEKTFAAWADSQILSPDLLMIMLLPVLIFESAFKMSAHAFRTNMSTIITVAFSCYVFTTAFQGALTYVALWAAGVRLSETFLFASMVSATDPVAVVALLEDIGAPFGMRTVIEGESLLNDGIAIVGFKVCRLALRTELDLLECWSEWYLPLKLVAGVSGSMVLGVVCGYVFVFFIPQLLLLHKQQHCANLLIVYSVFFVADRVISGSGVLAVVSFGLTMNYFQHYLNPGMVEKTKEVLGKGSFDMIVTSLLMAPVSVAGRAAFMAIFFLINQWLRGLEGRSEKITDYLCYTWGGLRGALPLLLSWELREMRQELAESGMAPQPLVDNVGHICLRNLVLTCGTVFGSLFIQGLTFELLCTKVGLKRRSEYKNELERQMMTEVRTQKVEELLQKWKSDWTGTYTGVNWTKIRTILNELFEARRKQTNPKRSQEKMKNSPENTGEEHDNLLDMSTGSAGERSVGAASQFYVHGTSSAGGPGESSAGGAGVSTTGTGESEVDYRETPKAYYRIMKAEVWQLWQQGILSPSSVQHLINAFNHAIDVGTHQHYLFWKCILTERGIFDKIERHVAIFCQKLARFFIKYKLLQQRPRDHSVSEDWFTILLTVAAIIEAALSTITVTQHMTEPESEWYIVIETMICTIFFMEQFFQLVNRHMRKRQMRTKRGRMVMVISCCMSAAYLLIVITLAIAIWPKQSHHLHPTRKCMKSAGRYDHKQLWRSGPDDPAFCHLVRWLLLVVPAANAIIKMILSFPVLIYLLGEFCDEMRRSKARVMISALDALRHLTQTVELDRNSFIGEEAFNMARMINAELSTAADRKLTWQFKSSSEFADVVPLLRTRRTARAAVYVVRREIEQYVERGLLPEEDAQHIKHLILKAAQKINRLSWVQPPSLREQVKATPWLQQCPPDTLNELVNYIVQRFTDPDKHAPRRVLRGEGVAPTETGDRLWFVHQGIVMVVNSPYAKREKSGEGHTRTSEIHFAGTWVNEGKMIDDEAEPAEMRGITRAKLYYLEAVEARKIERYAPEIYDAIRAYIDCQRLRWQLRHKAEMQRLTGADLTRILLTQKGHQGNLQGLGMPQVADKYTERLVGAGKVLVVIRGQTFDLAVPGAVLTATVQDAPIWYGPKKVAVRPHGDQPATFVEMDDSAVRTELPYGSTYGQSTDAAADLSLDEELVEPHHSAMREPSHKPKDE